MAQNDPYAPNAVSVPSSGSTTFDGSDGETNAAIVSGMMGSFDAEVYLEAHDGGSWQEVAQLTDANDNTTFSATWHTQFNRLLVSSGARRIRIDNVDSASGYVAVDGDER